MPDDHRIRATKNAIFVEVPSDYTSLSTIKQPLFLPCVITCHALKRLQDDPCGSNPKLPKNIPQGLNRLRKKSERRAKVAHEKLAGAKARLILLALSARLKPCPYYKAPRTEFFCSL
jgi:hypothetical protein